jgi:hypothetical protein
MYLVERVLLEVFLVGVASMDWGEGRGGLKGLGFPPSAFPALPFTSDFK